jgi:hypothetical protein
VADPRRSDRLKLAFVAVLTITLLAGLAQVMMASCWTVPTPIQTSVFEAMGFAWKAGIGVIFGLGGRAA